MDVAFISYGFSERAQCIDMLHTWLNGVVWVQRENKRQRAQAKENCIACLRQGCHLLVFPEGTWNLTAEKPMLPMSWGIIEMAQATGRPIIPITLDYTKRLCRYSIGAPVYVAPTEDRQRACTALRDTMASLRWVQWEKQGTIPRSALQATAYTCYTQERIAEYGLLSEAQLRSWVLDYRESNTKGA